MDVVGIAVAMKQIEEKRNISPFELIIILFLISFIVKIESPHFKQLRGTIRNVKKVAFRK